MQVDDGRWVKTAGGVPVFAGELFTDSWKVLRLYKKEKNCEFFDCHRRQSNDLNLGVWLSTR